ncbi:helix-turn-helix transcriptional regulator [Micromonospora sp. M51]|uniref:helix-turn-helix transcriptional regulator n=1 Tax=Micromonospora sp. M51 TaxID=2824889 RepID=UPI001B37446B|nr:helix-turn-helix transcriptional regulator [Micromonospora sp. M51]
MEHTSPSSSAHSAASQRFRWELRNCRVKRGLTQRALADLVRFSRETVAAVESGRRFGSHEFALRCDDVLGTGGRLAALWPQVAAEQLAQRPTRTGRPAAAAPTGRAPRQPALTRRIRHDRAASPVADVGYRCWYGQFVPRPGLVYERGFRPNGTCIRQRADRPSSTSRGSQSWRRAPGPTRPDPTRRADAAGR